MIFCGVILLIDVLSDFTSCVIHTACDVYNVSNLPMLHMSFNNILTFLPVCTYPGLSEVLL